MTVSGVRLSGPALALISALTFGCGSSESPSSVDVADLSCVIPAGQIFDGGPGKDGIPALSNPELVTADGPGLEYLSDDDRVIGLLWNGDAIAIPHNIGWWHEIVNLDLEGLRLAVTFCPLTGSSLAFDRAAVGGATFGVSGLLFRNNLIMYDRNNPESLWPQMARGARCGARTGAGLDMIPVIEMTWAGWRTLHPETRVVSGANGLNRNYTVYPYGSYDVVGNDQLLFPMESVDRTRPLKERVLGIPADDGSGGIAFPFGELAKVGGVAVVEYRGPVGDVVVLWDAHAEAAMAFRPVAAGQTLSLEARDGTIVDVETGSTWGVDGLARSGPLTGDRLVPVNEAYVAFWFAWAAFNDGTATWTAPRAS